MADDLTYFVWQVPEKGYQWKKTKAHDIGKGVSEQEKIFLTDLVPLGGTCPRRWYQPLEETGLFRNFAEVEPTQESILAFANRYGSLGGTPGSMIPVLPGRKPNEMVMGYGESIYQWTKEIWAMREMVNLWSLTQDESGTTGLSQFIKWDGSEGVMYEGPQIPGTELRTRAWIATTEIHPEILGRFSPGELRGPALYHIQRGLNKKLSDHGVTARLLWDTRFQRLNLHVVPGSLIGCLWLQFARAIDGNRAFRRCPDCRKWFETTPHVTRADRVFCSPSCKASAHRKKIAEARKLHGEGLSLKEIAGRLQTNIKTVKGWVKK